MRPSGLSLAETAAQRPTGLNQEQLPNKPPDFEHGGFPLTVFAIINFPFTGLLAVRNGLLCSCFKEGDSGSYHSCDKPTAGLD